MRLWFFVGDTIDWLKGHSGVTGVGRVTIELCRAAIEDRDPDRLELVPCILDSSKRNLVPVSPDETLAYLHDPRRPGVRIPAALEGAAAPILGSDDRLLFTGVVWSRRYQGLFRKLHERGVDFSVLVYDLIPFEHPEFVSDEHRALFAEWLPIVVSSARRIFVSSLATADQIYRWAAMTGAEVRAAIVPVTFGVARLAGATGATSADEPDSRIATLEPGHFVLSVGTIDRRKNQTALVRVWSRLMRARSDMPTLVLVGRDDLALSASAEAAELIRGGRLAIVEGLSDEALSQLYRTCLFALFPSLSEGYGLPVAESIEAGKLCLAADLPQIVEHAGDFAWYFDPADDGAIAEVVQRALDKPAERLAAEQRIAARGRPAGWDATFGAIRRALADHATPSEGGPKVVAETGGDR